LQIHEVVVEDKEIIKTLPVGTEVPAAVITTDICSNCGCIYATSITEGKAVKPPKLLIPNQQHNLKWDLPGMSNPKSN